MNIYIASSFCYENKDKTSERKYIIDKTVNRIKAKLGEEHNYYILHHLVIPNAWDMSLEEWSLKVYEHDLEALNNADLVIFLSFGKENNAGSVWEIGYIVGRNSTNNLFPKQKIIMIKMTDEIESLMITNSLKIIIKESEIEKYDWLRFPEQKTVLAKLS